MRRERQSKVLILTRPRPDARMAFAVCCGLLLLLLLRPAWGDSAPLSRYDDAPVPESPFISVAQTARPSVVNIRIERSVTDAGVNMDPMLEMYREYFPGEAGEGTPFAPPGSGTGFVVSSRGHILTNNHVVASADEIWVRFSGESRSYPAELVGADPASDLAVLKIERDGLAPLTFGDSDRVRVGDWAIAVGNPFGNLEGSLTVGVVSAKGRRDLAIHGGAPRYQDFLQTDAAINFGNSGGPLLDIAGRVIGVNTAINKAGRGIGFAIPSNYARRVFEQIAAHGRVIRGYLGAVTSDHATDGQPDGALVEKVLPDTPAARAGLKEGDVVIAFGGQEVVDDRDLQFLVSDAELGVEADCRVRRDGREADLKVVPVEEPEKNQRRQVHPDAWLGVIASPATGDDPRVTRLRDALGVEAERGMMIVAVVPDSPAAAAELRPGDVILEVDGKPADDADAWRRLVQELADRKKPIPLLVDSGGVQSYRLIAPQPESREG